MMDIPDFQPDQDDRETQTVLRIGLSIRVKKHVSAVK
jgi:hypothetical protein